MLSIVLAVAVLGGGSAPGSGHYGGVGFQPYYTPAHPSLGPVYSPGFQPIQPPFAVPVVGGSGWGLHPYPPYPAPEGMYYPKTNPWSWSPDAPPTKRLDEKTPDPKADNPPLTKLPATVVLLAARDVSLSINGTRLARTVDREVFRTPALESGSRYTYELVATVIRDGKSFTDTRRIEVEPGRRTEIDLRSLGARTAIRSAEVTIIAPEGTRVRVNGTVVVVKGRQSFRTPGLEAGQRYHYEVEAEVPYADGKTRKVARKVAVEAGKNATVDFTP